MIQGSLYVIIDLLIGAKFINLYLIMACGVMFFTKNLRFRKKIVFLLDLFFSWYYCSIDLKRQLEHSEFPLDTSSLVFFFTNNGSTTIRG